MHLIIYSPILTPRIKYIFNFIFKDILNADVELTGTPDYFLQSEHTKISYAEHPLGNELFFKNSTLLFNKKIELPNLKTIKFGDYHVPFAVQQSALPFDVFATSFFIISRYEEYLHRDKSDLNFTAKDSYQYKWNMIDKPVIDEWALLIKNLIHKKYPDFKFQEKSFSYRHTINFQLKPDVPTGFFSKSKFILKSIINKKQPYLTTLFDDSIGLGTNRASILANLDLTTDPNEVLYFVSFHDDMNNMFQYQNSLPLLKNKNIGLLHPCLPDLEKGNMLKINIAKLNQLHPQPNKPITQQIDELKIPACYLHMLNNGITSDYSMGYDVFPGFRAGTCTPFFWYDLQLDKATALNVKSYCINDKALQKLTPEEIKKLIKEFIVAVQLVNGHFYTAWQLKSLSENANFRKLKQAFNVALKYSQK